MDNTDTVLVEAELLVNTNKAWLVKLSGDGSEHWLPISECEHYVSQGCFSVPRWLAIEKGIIEE